MLSSSQSAASATKRPQTISEEIANAVTHGVGTLLSIACLTVGIVFAAIDRNPWNIVSVSIYGATMVLLYLFSTLYHAITNKRGKRVLQYFDHAAICLLIAGSYTPFSLGAIRLYSPGWAWSIFGIEWGLAIVGIAFQCCCIGRYRALSNASYLLMGWVALIAAYPLCKAMDFWAIFWTLIGGLCYSVGVVFYNMKKVRYMHAIWHLFVLCGTLVQFFVIFRYIVLK